MKRLVWLAVGLALAAGSAAAQGAAGTIVRGVVTAATPARLTVSGRDGRTVVVGLAPSWTVAVLKPIPVSAIGRGSLIDDARMPQAGGAGAVAELLVFPPGARMGAGRYPWDPASGSITATSAVGRVAAFAGGRALQVAYSSGMRRVIVPPRVQVVQVTPNGPRALIQPGATVYLVAAPGPGGGLTANAVATGAGGVPPPL